jgi:hypothetical protein
MSQIDRPKTQDLEEFLGEDGGGDSAPGEISGEVEMTPSDEESSGQETVYTFTASDHSVRQLGRKGAKAGRTAFQAGMAVDEFKERRHQERRTVRRRRMKDAFSIFSFLSKLL